MASTMKLPVGIDDFRKLRESHFYYVDKTRLIEQLLLNWSEVTLFTRPRRFGKTLFFVNLIHVLHFIQHLSIPPVHFPSCFA